MTCLLGRERALELLLGSELVDAELAERYGLVNRAVPANELAAFVDRLARRIARLRPEVVAAIKATVETITPKIPTRRTPWRTQPSSPCSPKMWSHRPPQAARRGRANS